MKVTAWSLERYSLSIFIWLFNIQSKNVLYWPFQRVWSIPGRSYIELDHTNQEELALASTGHPTPCRPSQNQYFEEYFSFGPTSCSLWSCEQSYKPKHCPSNIRIRKRTRYTTKNSWIIIMTWWLGESRPSGRLNASTQSTLATRLETRTNVRKIPAFLSARICSNWIYNAMASSGQFSTFSK